MAETAAMDIDGTPSPGAEFSVLCRCGRCVQGGLISHLGPGQRFKGKQTVQSSPNRSETWTVLVAIEHIDLCAGLLSGSMEARDVVRFRVCLCALIGLKRYSKIECVINVSHQRVLTHWEGEIVNNVSAFFVTRKWRTSHESDMSHWQSFPGFDAVRPLLDSIVCDERDEDGVGLAARIRRRRDELTVLLSRHRYVYMRY